MSQQNWKPFDALDLLIKTLETSKLSLGSSHSLTQELQYNINNLVTGSRKVANEMDPYRRYCPVKKYEDDCDIYIVDTEMLNGKIDGIDIGNEMGWAPSEVILHRGALIECVDLVKASHLNGKRGWIYDYDDATERHVVHFEDEDTKECLVKPGNLRLLFFGEEYETSDESTEATNNNGNNTQQTADTTDDDSEYADVPDLLR